MTLLWGLALFSTLVVLASAGAPPQSPKQTGSVLHKRFEGLNRGSKVHVEPKYRLSDAVEPRSYDISVVPIVPIDGVTPPTDRDIWTTRGFAVISVEIVRPTSVITLNIDNITISSYKVTNVNTSAEVTVTAAEDKAEQFYNLTAASALEVGSWYKIELDFQSYVGPIVRGLYQAKYLDVSGKERWLATSQFETVGFRGFAPGFDEPRFKAEFTLHIGRDPSYNSASNTPRDEQLGQDWGPDDLLPDGYVWDHYMSTPKMSSYLVALVVSDFAREGADTDILGKEVGIYGPPHLITEKKGGVFAANGSAHLLKAFGDKLGVPYTLAKMDSVGVPREYFRFGAMENWGLNIYKDNLLLFYNGESSEASRYQIMSILAHELGHQWFGNLITCQWWSQIFLNEGFATYMSFYGVQATNPEYDARRTFLYETVHSALRFDPTSGSHPVINTGLREEVEAMSIFDTISYKKGASLLRMLEGIFGEEVFYNGLKAYLADMQFKPSTQDDLFRNLEKAVGSALPAGKNISYILKTWTEKKGFPLIRVDRSSDSSIYISQERFRNNANGQLKELDPDELWEVPIAIATPADPMSTTPKVWMEKDVLLRKYDIDTTKWLIVNPGGYGFYRTLYDTSLLRLILEQLNADHKVVDGLTKSQLISDYFTFADEGMVQYETAMELTKFLGEETDHVVWMTVVTALDKIVTAEFSTGGALETFKAYLLPKVSAALNEIGRQQAVDEHGVNTLLRPYLLSWACALGEEECLKVSSDYVSAWSNATNPMPVPLDIQSTVYCSAVEYNSSHFDFLLEQYLKFKGESGDYATTQASRLANALTCSTEKEHIVRLIASTVSEGDYHIPIASNHIRAVLVGLGTTSHGRQYVQGLIRDSFAELAAKQDSVSLISGVLSDMSVYQNSEADIEKHVEIVDAIKMDENIYPVIEASLNATENRIRNNMQWANTILGNVNAWLSKNV